MMSKLEYQVEHERLYGIWAERNPKSNVNWKSYIDWQLSGRQVKKGEVAKEVGVKIPGRGYRDIDGEYVPEMVTRNVKVFHVSQTDERYGPRYKKVIAPVAMASDDESKYGVA